MTATSILAQRVVERDALHDAKLSVAREYAQGIEIAPDIGRGSPRVTHVASPPPRLAAAPFAHAQQNGTAGSAQCVADELIGTLRIDVRRVTPVVFQVVDTPASILHGILIFVAQRAWHTGTGSCAGIAVDAQFQPLAVYVVSHGLHAMRKAYGIGLDETVGIALAMPAVVNVDVHISCIAQSAFYHSVSNALDDVLRDVALEFVPCAPPHLRRISQSFTLLCHNAHRCQDEAAYQ